MGSRYPKALAVGACSEFDLPWPTAQRQSEVKWGDVGAPYTQGNHLSIQAVSLGSFSPYRFHFSLLGPWELSAGLQQQGGFCKNSSGPELFSSVPLTNIQDRFFVLQKDLKYRDNKYLSA